MKLKSIALGARYFTLFGLLASGFGCPSGDLRMVEDLGVASIDRFTASASSIILGQSVTIEWETSGVRSVIIEPQIGLQDPKGSYTVSPLATTTYTLRIESSNGPLTSSVRVEVTGGPPRILAFTAAPQIIMAGDVTTLQWTTQNTTRVVISPDIGEKDVSGSVVITPMATTVYKLIAMNDQQMTSQELTVTVNSGDNPIIHSFTASPLTVIPGQKSTLSWQTSNATQIDIDNGAGTALPSTGTLEITPMQTATYTLTARNGNQSVNSQVTVTVQQSGPIIISLTADPPSISTGESSTIRWETSNATDVSFDQGIGQKATTGSLIVMPEQSTIYTLTANGPGGQTTQTVNIEVASPNAPRVTSFTVSPSSIVAGQSATLSWQTTNADTVSIDNGVGSQMTNGQATVNPSVSTTYVLMASNSSGSRSAQTTLTVTPSTNNGDLCSTAIAIPTGGGMLQGSTAGLNNDYQPPRMCAGYSQIGPDIVYRTALNAGDIMVANASFDSSLDGAIYVVTDCSDLANTCVAGADRGFSGDDETLRYVARQTSDHYLMVDAALATHSGTHNLDISFYSGDTCASAAPLVTDGSTEWYTTAGLTNNYNLTASDCTGYAANAYDRAYQVELNAGDQLIATLSPSPSYDPALYLVSNCSNVGMNCLAGSDKPNGQNENLYTVVQQTGTYYLIADGFLTNGSGSGNLSAEIKHGDTCTDAYTVPSSGGTFNGTTTGYTANYGIDRTNGSCTGFSQIGPDAVYRIELQDGQSMLASVDSTWDSSLYLITDCANSATTCVAGEDNGNPEEITYRNSSGQTATYYLVVDSFLASISGDYNLQITIN